MVRSYFSNKITKLELVMLTLPAKLALQDFFENGKNDNFYCLRQNMRYM